jgi:hypothetical protein
MGYSFVLIGSVAFIVDGRDVVESGFRDKGVWGSALEAMYSSRGR